MPIAESLLPEFDREMGMTRRVLERVPEAHFAWKPHPKSMALGRLAEHLAELPGWAAMTITQSGLDMPLRPADRPLPQTRAAVLQMFERNLADARAALTGRSDPELMAPWTLRAGGKEVFTMPKAVVLRGFVMNHMIHHRAQMTVYLRLHDVPVPSLYGPSADESM